MEGPQPGKINFGEEEGGVNGGEVPKSGRLENSAPVFLADTWYLGELFGNIVAVFLSTFAKNIVFLSLCKAIWPNIKLTF